MERAKQMITYLVFFGTLLMIWELSSRFNERLLFILPAPSKILMRLLGNYDRFFFHTVYTLKEMAGGFIVAFCVAFPLAWIMDQRLTARIILQPVFVVIQCIPMFALAPIMVLWFDWSYTAILIPTALMIFFPLTMSIYQGLRSTPQYLLDYFTVNQGTPWQTFWKLKLPWAIPHICAGVRISAAIAGIGAIAGEWAGAQHGLGMLMMESRRGADLETTFAALLCLTVISLSLYVLTTSLEKIASSRKPILVTCKSFFCKPKIVFSTLLVGILLFLSGCQSSSKAKEVRIVLDWLPNPDHVALYVGVHNNFFSDRGINLKIIKIPEPGDVVPYVTSHKTDLALCYMPNTMRAIERGAKIQPIAILIKEPLNAIIYKKDGNIQKPEDLNDKIIGYSVDGSATTFLDAILQTRNIKVAGKRNVSFDIVTMLGMGQVDAIYGGYWNIESEHLRQLGVETDYFKLSEFGVPNYYELLVITRKDSPQTNPLFMERFQESLQESIDYCLVNPEESFEIYLKANPDKSESTAVWERAAWEKTLSALARSQHLSSEVWDNFHQWLDDHNLLKRR